MLTLGLPLSGKSILSLRTGSPVGLVMEPIINPNNLKIEGWFAQESSTKHTSVLLSQDIRDILPQGFVVNDHEALSNPRDLIRLKEIIDYEFQLIGKVVVTNHRRRVGKVTDFAFDKDSFIISKLYVSQSLVKSFSGGALIIDRSQIIEITNKRIVIKEATATDAAPMPAAA